MGSFGEKLRREREMRGISLDEISLATKIGTRSLAAIEEENFSILPGGIFNKGFVRAYARFLGMNEDQAVADYQAAAKDQPVSVKTIADQSAMAKANRLAAEQARESEGNPDLWRALGYLCLAVAMAFGGYQAYRRGFFTALKHSSLHHQMKQQAQSVAPSPVTAAPTTPAPAIANPVVNPTAVSSPVPQVSASVAVTESPAKVAEGLPVEFTVSIKTSAESWLSVIADGKPAFQRLFAPNEEQTITAKTNVRIKIGNPSGTELSLNGKPLAITGSLAHPRTVTVDASGLASE